MKCRFCGYTNEDGVLFCEKCKADLDFLANPHPAPNSAPHSAQELQPMTSESSPHVAEATQQPASETVVPVLEPVTESSGVPEAVAEMVASPVETLPAEAMEKPGTAEAPALPAEPKSDRKPANLVVLRGLKIDKAYPLYPGKNYIGRTDEKPVDIDLDEQEAPDRIWCSRQHAVLNLENDQVTIEDLNSLNGTFVNRNRVYPGQVKVLQENDVIQIGTVHMKLTYA